MVSGYVFPLFRSTEVRRQEGITHEGEIDRCGGR